MIKKKKNEAEMTDVSKEREKYCCISFLIPDQRIGTDRESTYVFVALKRQGHVGFSNGKSGRA